MYLIAWLKEIGDLNHTLVAVNRRHALQSHDNLSSHLPAPPTLSDSLGYQSRPYYLIVRQV